MNNEMQKRLKEYTDSRDEALLSLDMQKMKDHCNRWKIAYPENAEVFWIAIHKARLNINYFSDEVKEVSRKWLEEKGYSVKIEMSSLYGRIRKE